MSTFKTAKGKTIATFIDPKTAHYKIKFVEGGEMPPKLTGLYTSEGLADQGIELYLAESKLVRAKE